MTVREYQAAHPEQQELMQSFDATVQAKGVPTSVASGKAVKIAVIYPGDQISDYWKRSIISFTRRLDELGLRYELSEHFTKPGIELELQKQHLSNELQHDPDYLIFTMDVFKHKKLIDSLLLRKRPKIILQNITTPLREWEGNQPFMYVGFDHAKGASMISDYFIKNNHGPSEYGVLFFTKGYVSTMRGETFIAHTKSNSGHTLFDTAYTDGRKYKAFKAATAMLANINLKYIYACSTDIAMGAVEAIKQADLSGMVMINGWGGGQTELEAILAGDLDVTVMRMNDDNGVAMAEAIRLDCEGNGHQVPTIYPGDMKLVERGIHPKRLDALKKRAFRYSEE